MCKVCIVARDKHPFETVPPGLKIKQNPQLNQRRKTRTCTRKARGISNRGRFIRKKCGEPTARLSRADRGPCSRGGFYGRDPDARGRTNAGRAWARTRWEKRASARMDELSAAARSRAGAVGRRGGAGGERRAGAGRIGVGPGGRDERGT